MHKDWEYNHAGVFAKDFQKTCQYYKYLGIAPDLPQAQHPFPPEDECIWIEFGEVVKPTAPDGTYFLDLLYVGDLVLEVLYAPPEPPKGESLTYGEGINHFCYSVPDIYEETDKLVSKGLRLIMEFIHNGVRLEDYLDTREHGNILLSLRALLTEGERAERVRNAAQGTINWEFRGHSAVVKDVDKTAEYYQYLDIATIEPPVMLDSSSISDVKVYGKTPETTIRAKTRAAKIGKTVLELIQPLDGKGIYKESLDRRGEGIIDLTFTVDDLDRETARLVKKGVPVIFSGKPQNGKAFAYFDTRQDGGDAMIKLIQR